jgi:heat shock protein HslJ
MILRPGRKEQYYYVYRKGDLFLMIFTRLGCLIFCIFFFVSFTGCLAPVSPAHAPSGQSWELVSYNLENKMVKPEPDMTVTIKFGLDGLVSGNIGCTEYSGTYLTDREIISFNNLELTDGNCTEREGMKDMEQPYFKLLTNTTRFSLDLDTLTLSQFDERKLLVFKRTPF